MRHLKYLKNCKYCKSEFTSTRRDAGYCSQACRAISNRLKKMESGGTIPEQPVKKPLKKEELIRPDNVVMQSHVDVAREVKTQLTALENKKNMAEKKSIEDKKMMDAGKFWCKTCSGYFDFSQFNNSGRLHHGHEAI